MTRPFVPHLAVAFFVLFSGFAAPANADSYQAGLEAYKRGDYAAAYREWLPLAQQGHAKAQFKLGWMYDNGEGMPEDDREAVKWYRRAAEQGNATAQSNLGLMYEIGEGVPEDYVHAYAWMNLAAAQGHDGAGKDKDSLRRRMTSSQIARAQELSHVLQRRTEGRAGSGSAGDPPAGTGGRRSDVRKTASGSGFFVDARGHVLTNRHVVDGCARLTVALGSEERDASLRAVSEADDLALLSTGRRGTVGARFRSTRARHGETVAVAGFPLGGLLASDLHVTGGGVSALAGAGDDPRLVQITAPVQPGNSGGPLLDAGGRAIGVVVSRLDALKTAMLSGAMPQNVNFAIKGAVARSFLDIHGIDYAAAGPGKAIGGEAVARRARRFTVSVACWN